MSSTLKFLSNDTLNSRAGLRQVPSISCEKLAPFDRHLSAFQDLLDVEVFIS